MSGSAKMGLLGVLLMIVFVAVVWDRGNEEGVGRRTSEIIVLPEPDVLAGSRVRASVQRAGRKGDGGASEVAVVGAIQGPRREKAAAVPEPHDSGPDRADLEELAAGLRPVPPRRADRGSTMERYVVREGDSLWGIAQQVYGNGGLWERIHSANRERIGDPDRLVAGTALVIPASQRPRVKAPQGSVYTVRKGDTLYGISRSTLGSGERWGLLLEANRNRISNPDLLVAGTRLVIPGGPGRGE